MKGKLQLIGWGMFIVCAGLFIVSGVRNRDIFGTLASVIFLAACFVFIADLKRK